MMSRSCSHRLFKSWVDNLILLVHVCSKVSTWSCLTELKWFWDSRIFGFLQLLHLIYESFLNGSKVWNWSSSVGLKWKQLLCQLTLLSWLKVILLSASLFINMCLHSWWKLWSGITWFSIPSNSLLSFVFIPLHHHLKARYENTPRNVTGSELSQHGFVDVVVNQSALSRLLIISLMETERFWMSFVLCKWRFTISLSSFSFLPQEILVQRLSSTLWNFSRFNLLGKMLLKFSFTSGDFFLNPNLSGWLSFIWVLLELEQNRHSHIVLSFASLGNHVLLVDQLFFQRTL